MKIQQFLEHHGIAGNPFADEDAQTDLVFKGACIRNTFHPAWDKIYGDPSRAGHVGGVRREGLGQDGLAAANRPPSDRLQRRPSRTSRSSSSPTTISIRSWTAFATAFPAGGGGSSGCSTHWRLWDHIDAILALAMTQLVDRALDVQAGAASGGPRRGPAAGFARPLPGPRPAAPGRLLRPLDRRNSASSGGGSLAASCVFRPGGRSGTSPWASSSPWRSWPWSFGCNWHWLGGPWPWLAIAAGWAPRLWRLAKLAMAGVADRPQRPRAGPQRESACGER